METLRGELIKFCELSAYDGGHDALSGLTKKGRIKFFKAYFKPRNKVKVLTQIENTN